MISEGGEIIAAFTTAAEVAYWIETRLREIDRAAHTTDEIGSGEVADAPLDQPDMRAHGAGSRRLPVIQRLELAEDAPNLLGRIFGVGGRA